VESEETELKQSEQEWYDYWRVLFPTVTVDKIKKFQGEYQGSEEEKGDVLKAYEEGQGKMSEVIDNVMLATDEDEGRFREMIEAAIAAKEVKRLKGFKADVQKDAKRKKRAEKVRMNEKKRWKLQLENLCFGYQSSEEPRCQGFDHELISSSTLPCLCSTIPSLPPSIPPSLPFFPQPTGGQGSRGAAACHPGKGGVERAGHHGHRPEEANVELLRFSGREVRKGGWRWGWGWEERWEGEGEEEEGGGRGRGGGHRR